MVNCQCLTTIVTNSRRSSGQDMGLVGLGMANSKSGDYNLFSSDNSTIFAAEVTAITLTLNYYRHMGPVHHDVVVYSDSMPSVATWLCLQYYRNRSQVLAPLMHWYFLWMFLFVVRYWIHDYCLCWSYSGCIFCIFVYDCVPSYQVE